ncbi:hypothetical protein KC221_28010, partial [Mycobacterium tuberculosis]|nr:hypothetical protein [Mycobacterium tuberculosis]
SVVTLGAKVNRKHTMYVVVPDAFRVNVVDGAAVPMETKPSLKTPAVPNNRGEVTLSVEKTD